MLRSRVKRQWRICCSAAFFKLNTIFFFFCGRPRRVAVRGLAAESAVHASQMLLSRAGRRGEGCGSPGVSEECLRNEAALARSL